MVKSKKEFNSTTPLQEMADEAFKNYEDVLRKGLKLQQDTAQWWSKALRHKGSGPDWQKPLADLASNANAAIIPAMHKQLEEVLALLERNNRTCVELVTKATEAARSSELAESQHKWLEFWKSSVTAAGANAEALAEVNAKIINSCIDWLEKSSRSAGSPLAKAA